MTIDIQAIAENCRGEGSGGSFGFGAAPLEGPQGEAPPARRGREAAAPPPRSAPPTPAAASDAGRRVQRGRQSQGEARP